MNSHEIARMTVLAPDGKAHRLAKLWRDRPIVLVFLRHFA